MANEGVRQKLPVGMVIILVLIGWGVVSYLLAAFRTPLYQLGPVLLSGAGAIVVNLVVAGILAAIFYGILKRMGWARKLAIGWYIVLVVLLLANLISFLRNKMLYDSYYANLLPPEIYSLITPGVITASLASAFVFGFVAGLIIVIYLAGKKDFFVN